MITKRFTWLIGITIVIAGLLYLFIQTRINNDMQKLDIKENEKQIKFNASNKMVNQGNNVSLNPSQVVDTKIDPTIKPIAPEKDPSNTVRY